MMEIDINHLVKEYGNMISMIAHRMIQNKEIACEAAQEVWYELCKSFHSLKGVMEAEVRLEAAFSFESR